MRAYIAYRGVTGTTGVNMAINIIQITALLVFTVIAIAYRTTHKQDDVGWHLSNGVAVTYQVDQTDVVDDKGVKHSGYLGLTARPRGRQRRRGEGRKRRRQR